MRIFKIIYSVSQDLNLIKIFNRTFVKKYKDKCKIIYNHKIYPLQSEFHINNKNKIIGSLFIRLISFTNTFNINQITKGCKSFLTYFEISNLQKNTNKYSIYLKYSFYELSKMIYNLEKEKNKKMNKVKIFGKNFVQNNKDKCVIIYKDQIYPLKEYFSLDEIGKEKINKLEIILIEFESISNKSYMFHECNLLEEFPLSKENNKKLKHFSGKHIFGSSNKQDKSDKFYLSIKISNTELKGKNNEDKTIVTSILNEYSSFSFLPDKSRWNSCICTNIEHMFDGCKSLLYLPDLSKWAINNVKDISYLFTDCSSLLSLPDISNWNTNNVTDMSFIFKGCSSLLSIPDISKWNTNNVTNMRSMFYGCSSLISLPDISN